MLPIEEEIMREIGFEPLLGYQFYEGSGTCATIRRKALEKLPDTLKKYHKNSQIKRPDYELLDNLKELDLNYGGGDSEIKKTWEGALIVIRAHIPGLN